MSGGGTPAGSKSVRFENVSGGSIIGAGAEGVVGQEVTVHGHVLTVHLHTAEAADAFRGILSLPTEVRPKADATAPDAAAPSPAADPSVERRLDELLHAVKEMQAAGVKAPEVAAGGVHLSSADLLLRKAVLLEAQAEELMIQRVTEHAEEIRGMVDRGGGRAAVDLAGLVGGLDGAYEAALREARQLLEEAHRLEPHNTEVMLHLAQICGSLEDFPEERRLAERVLRLLDAPKDDAERLRRAQAMFLLATSADNVHPGLLRDARAQFERLGRTEWVRQVDDLLRAESGAGGGFGWGGGPGMGLDEPAGASAFDGGRGGWDPDGGFDAAPAAAGAASVPTGRWHVELADQAGSTMSLDLRPDGTLHGAQSVPTMGMHAPFAGTWLWQPPYLTLQGTIGGMQPFHLTISIQAGAAGALQGVDANGTGYRFTRA